MPSTQAISGDDFAALVLHATTTKSSAAVGYNSYQVRTDDGVVDCRFLGFDASAQAVFKVDKVALSVGGEAFLQSLRVSGLGLDFGEDGKVGVSFDRNSVSVKANLGGVGVQVGLCVGITLPGVTISLDFVQFYKDLYGGLCGAADDFAEAFTAGLNGNKTHYDRHIIMMTRLDLHAAARHHFGDDWWAENRDGTAYGWFATDGKKKFGFDGKYSLDNYVKDLTQGMSGDFGARHLKMSNPHSWWLVQKFHGPPSLPCPNHQACDGLRCKSRNDLSKYQNVAPLKPRDYKQSSANK